MFQISTDLAIMGYFDMSAFIPHTKNVFPTKIV